MLIDAETIRWFISGVFFLMVGGISYVWKRELAQARHAALAGDKALDDRIADTVRSLGQHDSRIDANLQQINGIKQDFVSKSDLEKQLKIQLDPIKDGMREMKEDIREMGGDLKELLKRP